MSVPADPQSLDLRATEHLEARPRDNRYAVAVVVVDLATQQFCTKFQTLPIIDTRQFWHDVLEQAAKSVLDAKIGKLD